MGVLVKAALLTSLLFSSASAILTITAKGSKLFTSVAYQATPEDPLVNLNQCTLDVNLMKTMGVNSIRVYHVNPQANHDACMKVFADAGIYVWLDMDTFTTYITQDNPYWNAFQFSRYAEVMDAFIKYDNIAGFWVANEAINNAAGSGAALFIKAAVADMKAYRDSKNYRNVPIGYSAADIAELRPYLQNYLACGSSDNARIDFFGLNSYEWCGDNTYQGSGYPVLQAQAANYSQVIFFSETGCNVGRPRLWQDQASILGRDMVDTWSGAIAYEWVEETNNYGLVNYGSPGGTVLSGTPTAIQPDFTNLVNQWKTLNPTGVQQAAYTPSLSPPACPQSTAGGWLVNGDVSVPTLGVAAVTKVPISTVGAAVATNPGASATTTRASKMGPEAAVLTSASVASTAGGAVVGGVSGGIGFGGFVLAVLEYLLL
ncbi:glycoside hydrolase family protein [Venturia nashicola]|nr:glycoside hydrolase family protein [Venturia nashicola]